MFSYVFFSSVVIEIPREQQTAIKFRFKNELTATEMFKMLQKAYGNECLSRINVLEWCGKFYDGRESMVDDTRMGRPEPVKHLNTSQKYVLL